MAEFKCSSEISDTLEVADKLDVDKELEIGIFNDDDEIYAHVFLKKADAKKLAEHILHLLEESK